MSPTVLSILLPFLFAIFIPILHSRVKRIHVGWFVLMIPMILLIYYSRFVPEVASGKTFLATLQWIPTFHLNWVTYIDGLSLLFGLLITGMGALVILYSIYYLNQDEALHRFYVYLMIFMGAMLGVVFTDHLLILYVFWELTSIASFLLIAFWYERKQARYGALKSMLITVFGGLSMLIGFLLLFHLSGSFSIRENIELLAGFKNEGLFYASLVLILLGAFTKSAQFPFHIWLPDAMEAPTPVSAYLHSATMVKAGIYLVARFTAIFAGIGLWFWLVAGVGIVTMLWGSYTAIRQRDLKALLAYSTISQLGLIMCLLGIGSLADYDNGSGTTIVFTGAVFAALFHLINHATFKGTLFMVVGILDLELGTRDVNRLGGLARLMPITFTVAVLGSFSMAGLPPFNGFLSKEMFFEAVLMVQHLDFFSIESLGYIFPLLAWIGSVLTFVYCMIIVFQTFFGAYRPELLDREAREAPIGMLLSPMILGIIIVTVFFIPNVIGKYILSPAMYSIFPNIETEALQFDITIWHGFTTEVWMTIFVIVLGIILYATRRYWKGIYRVFPGSWTMDNVYKGILAFIENNADSINHFYMRGNGRDYIAYIYLFFIACVGGTIWYTGAFSINAWSTTPIAPYEWILTAVMIVAAATLALSHNRLLSIILNGVLGFSIALFFILFNAPDLALTQLVIETITTALFLLAFTHLPKLTKERNSPIGRWLKVIISVSVGSIFVIVALIVNGSLSTEKISLFFEDSELLMGGHNIVNAILGDFRAFDTMLEVVVLMIAGIGVYTLVKSKIKKEGTHENK